MPSFPARAGAGGKWQVSTTGGVAPRWRADGKALYFLAPDATLIAVPVTAVGTSFDAGTPVAHDCIAGKTKPAAAARELNRLYRAALAEHH